MPYIIVAHKANTDTLLPNSSIFKKIPIGTKQKNDEKIKAGRKTKRYA